MKRRTKWIACILSALILNGCAKTDAVDSGDHRSVSEETDVETVRKVDDMNTYVYARPEVLSGKKKVPLILYLCGTGCDPEQQPIESGYADLVQKEDLIVVSPDYNNAATYSEVGRLVNLINTMKNDYPVDDARVYSLGFSNGGATSVALTSEHPELFAGIAAYGWMVDLKNKENGYEMPFQVVQGTKEFVTEDRNGNPAVMRDEQEAIHSLLVYDHMISEDTEADYQKTPYWGYEPSSVKTEMHNGVQWTINDYQKTGYEHPYAQFLLVDGADHQPHAEEASYSWNFLKHFYRNAEGKIVEEKG